MSVLLNIPVWLFGDNVHFTKTLSELSCAELYHTMCEIIPSKSFRHVRKSEYVQLILHDFSVQRTCLLDCDLSHIASDIQHDYSRISKIFQDWYGKLVATSLHCLMTKQGFEGIPSILELVGHDEVPWFSTSFYDMDLALLHLPKKTILKCLQNVPSYIRPTYKTQSVQSCSLALVHYIQGRIHYLHSLMNYQIF